VFDVPQAYSFDFFLNVQDFVGGDEVVKNDGMDEMCLVISCINLKVNIF
jgi:hypothetical protein